MNLLLYYMEMNNMIRIELNGKKMLNRELTHDYIKWKLKLPKYYGKNLDALWDILSSWDRETKIIFLSTDCAVENLGEYGQSLVEVFQDSAEENHNISLEIINISKC